MPLGQPRDERRVVLEARPVDHAARRHLHRGVDQRRQAPARQRHDPRPRRRSRSPNRSNAATAAVAHRQIGEHARAQSNQEKWLARCDGVRAYPRAARRTGSPSPDRRWSPGSARCPARAAIASKLRSARARRGAHAAGASTSRAPADTRAAASAPRLRAISVSGATASSRRCSSTIASRSASPRPARRRARGSRSRRSARSRSRTPTAIASRPAALAMASRRPTAGSERTSCSTRSSRPPAPARRIAAYAARASAHVERSQRRRQPLPQRPAGERRPRQRSEQQRDPEVRVRPRRAARRLHDGEDRVAHAALARARQLGADRDRAAQHVLIGVSWKSWLGVMLPGFSALTSSTQASWAAPATASAVRTVAAAACADDRPRRRLTPLGARS